MAAKPLPPVPTGLPSPRSPTLSCAEMILPEGDTLRSISPSPYVERPPSPPSLYTHSNRSTHTIKLASAPPSRRGPSPHIKSPPLSAQSSRSTLRTMGDSEASSRKPSLRHDVLASSPTIHHDASGLHASAAGPWNGEDRRLSTASSIHSEDLENMRWPGFDSAGEFDDSGVDLEEEEERAHFARAANGADDADHERWLDGPSDGEDDLYSSAALSRRAEIILANAKKRLNVMEGNLRATRQSLVVSPTFNPVKMQSELSHQIAVARERDRRLYAGKGPIPPRTRSYYITPLSSNNSPGHARGLSETLPFPPTTRPVPSKRASSALGMGSGPWSPESFGQGRFPIRESRSFEVMRDPRNGWPSNDDRDHSLRSHSRGSRSPPNMLETLPEDGAPKLHRSASTTSDLRDQMNDLKGRISNLKQKAKEDHMRRRSMQNLRTPSPFTAAAETWYSGADGAKNGGSPVAADAGLGLKMDSPTRKALYEDEGSNSSRSTPKTKPVSTPPQQFDAVKVDPTMERSEAENTDKLYSLKGVEGGAVREVEAGVEDEEDAEDNDVDDDSDFVSVVDEDLEGGGDSVYEDAVYEMPVTERHEDRVDAFDYEHFFLHSAMGTYSSVSRRSSSSYESTDSAETTRPVTAVHTRQDSDSTKRISLHQRTGSVDSVSTVATFATAAEEQSDDEENEQMDQFSQQILSTQHAVTLRHATQNGLTSPRSDSVINMRKANSSPGQTSQTSRGSSPASDLVTGLQTSKIFTILLETPTQEPRLALNEEEKQLIYSLAASFQQVCANLQSTSGDQYERKEWRRRLDEARRLLNGEEFEGQPF